MVKHFIIDFSKLILMFKIRHDMEDTVQTNVLKKGEPLTQYDLQYYVYRVTRKYSKSIEQCDTLRAVIDDQFFKQTSSYFNRLFLSFVMFFVLPYLI
jgi:Mg2+ and Co2+ transporter CorA